MNYYSDLFSSHNHEMASEFDSWWKENVVRIERNNLHTFSGLVRNNMGYDYYYTYWQLIVNGFNQGVKL